MEADSCVIVTFTLLFAELIAHMTRHRGRGGAGYQLHGWSLSCIPAILVN